MISIKQFIQNYVKEINEENAAIFAGAGLSVSAGYVNWKELLRGIADELNLDIDKENDLISLAQFHVNESRNRNQINQKIIELFTKDTTKTNIHRVLARLPIKYYWTTNYDTVLEDVLKENNKRVDKKIDQRSLANNVPKRDVVLYKMHGDVLVPSDAVITKDDYETYNEKRQLFTTALQGDLVSKTFLFIGFSFEDPNLSYILGRIRVLITGNTRTHYAIFRKPKKEEYSSNSDFEYAKLRQKYKIEDLQRYSIQAVMIDEYSEIETILLDIEKNINKKRVFISGSANDYGSWSNVNAVSLIGKIVNALIIRDCSIVSGFGLGIGSYVISSAIQTISETKNNHFDEYLKINPFPFQLSTKEKQAFNTKYRDRILSSCGIAIFIFGNKKVGDEIKIADGVIEEYRIAKEKGLVIIPIGSTGYAANAICEEIKKDIDKYPYLKDKIEKLSSEMNIDELTSVVMSIINVSIGG